MSNKRKVIISSAVPLNNGDAALVFSLADALAQRGFSPVISTYHFKTVRRLYSDRIFTPEITDHKLFRKLPGLKKTAVKLAFPLRKSYREAEAIIAAPGGYLNDYYGFDHTLELLRKAKLAGKKTGVYAQSVGPLSAESKSKLLYYQQFIDFLFVRDDKSAKLMLQMGYAKDKFQQVEDGAFLLPLNQAVPKVEKLAAISVRAWKHDQRSEEQYIRLVVAITRQLVDSGYQVVFLSTCQGLPDYTNDAIMAQKIFERLSEVRQKKCRVDNNFYPFADFRETLKQYAVVVGTRLHMCILSLLADVPAFNISYEFKGRECYNYLGVPELSCDYNEDVEDAMVKFNHFMDKLPEYKRLLNERVEQLHQKSEHNLDRFISKLNL